jgi:hypothetical protein
VGLVACAANGDESSQLPSESSLETSTTVAKTPPEIRIFVQPGTADDFEGARDDVTSESCTREEGQWLTSGTVRNSGDQPSDYRIYTTFNDDDGDLRALVQTDVNDVAPGAQAEWQNGAFLPEENVTCILRVERISATR